MFNFFGVLLELYDGLVGVAECCVLGASAAVQSAVKSLPRPSRLAEPYLGEGEGWGYVEGEGEGAEALEACRAVPDHVRVSVRTGVRGGVRDAGCWVRDAGCGVRGAELGCGGADRSGAWVRCPS